MKLLEKRKKQKEYNRLINLRYKKWKKEHENDKEQELKEGFDVIQTTLKRMIDSVHNKSDKEILEAIYSIKCETQEDFDYKVYLFNDGDLRPEEEVWEIMNYRYAKNNDNLYNFNKERHIVNTLAFFVPFGFIFFVIMIASKWEILVLPIAIIAALFISMIVMLIGNKHNIDTAEAYGIPDNDQSLENEKLKNKIGLASSAIAAGSIIHNTKKAIKDITNVDSWKEMK